MTENPHDAPSSVVVPTENVEKPLRKEATWRTTAVVLAVLMALPAAGVAFFSQRGLFHLSGFEAPFALVIATHPLTFSAFHVYPGIIDFVDDPFMVRPADQKRRRKQKAEVGLFVFSIGWFVEWFLYGWLLDTWSYRRTLAKSLASKQLA
jgi:hypothetical protein